MRAYAAQAQSVRLHQTQKMVTMRHQVTKATVIGSLIGLVLLGGLSITTGLDLRSGAGGVDASMGRAMLGYLAALPTSAVADLLLPPRYENYFGDALIGVYLVGNWTMLGFLGGLGTHWWKSPRERSTTVEAQAPTPKSPSSVV
jgi:hypothetical protein